MIVTRIQLACDGEDCIPDYLKDPELRPLHQIRNHFPEDGALDGAMFNYNELRSAARREGWIRASRAGLMVDLCPVCSKAVAK